MRLGFGLGLSSSNNRRRTSKGPICEAIDQKVCISAMHKKKSVVLAPHVVFVCDGEQRLAAVESGKKNRSGISIYKVADLSDVKVLSDTPFTPEAGFDPNDPQFGNETVCVVKMV